MAVHKTLDALHPVNPKLTLIILLRTHSHLRAQKTFWHRLSSVSKSNHRSSQCSFKMKLWILRLLKQRGKLEWSCGDAQYDEFWIYPWSKLSPLALFRKSTCHNNLKEELLNLLPSLFTSSLIQKGYWLLWDRQSLFLHWCNSHRLMSTLTQ